MDELEKSCWSIAQDDEAGKKWCDENNYPGYTSYASLSDLTWRSPFFEDLKNGLSLSFLKFKICQKIIEIIKIANVKCKESL